MKILDKLDELSVNDNYLTRYKKLMCKCHSRYIEDDIYTEKHHMLPKSLFPEHSKDDDNIIILTAREHYIAHWMIAKATMNNKMWFAFNMMQRIIPIEQKNSTLYTYARKYIANAISESNTGRPMSQKNKDAMSERTKCTVVVKDKNENIFRVDVNDPRYISGELKYYRTGYKHKEETILKMITNNGVTGKKPFYNKKEKKHYWLSYIPKGSEWNEGFSDIYKNSMSETISKLVWYYNPLTNQNIRIPKNILPPDGFVEGRHFDNNPGFEKANSMTNVVDLKRNVVTKVETIESFHGPQSGRSTEKTIIYVYDKFIFTTLSRLQEYLRSVNIYIEGRGINSYEGLKNFSVKDQKKFKDKNKEKFVKLNKDKTLNELGILFYKLEDFQYDLFKEKEIVWTLAI